MGKKKIEPSGKKLSNGSKASLSESETPSISSEPTIPVAVSEVSVVGQEPLRAKKEDYKFAVPNIEQIAKREEEKKRQEYLKTIDTGQSRFTSLMGEFNRGFLSVGSAVPESIAIMAKKLEDSMGGEKPLEDYQTYKWAKAADKWIKDTYPTNPIYQDELGTKLASGAGQAVSFLLGGEASAGLKLSRGASMAYMGAAQSGVPEYENAKQLTQDANSLSEEQFIQKYTTDAEDLQRRTAQYQQLKGQDPERVAWDAFKYNAIIGTTEAIPFDIALSKFDKITNGSIRKAFISALEQGSTEAFQEVTSQYLSNLSAKEIYDKQREITEGLKDGAVPAFILGGILGGAGNIIAAKINDPNITPEEKSTLQTAQKEVEAQLKELPTDVDEIVSKPIENSKIKELTAKRDALEQQLTSNKELSDETKKILVEQSNDLDTQIEGEKEIAVKNNTNNSYLDSNISSLESQKNTLEEDMAKVPEDSKWAIQAQIENLNAKINDFKQQKNVEASEAIPAQTEAVRMLEETGSELNINEIKKEVQDAVQEQIPNEMDVRKRTTDGETLGKGDIQPEIIAGKEETISEQGVGYENIPQTKEKFVEEQIQKHLEENDFEVGSVYEQTARKAYEAKYERAQRKDVIPEDAEEFISKMVNTGIGFGAGQVYEMRVDFGMTTKDVQKGISDIKSGKESAPAKKIKEFLVKVKETGQVPFIQGTGGMAERRNMDLQEYWNLSKGQGVQIEQFEEAVPPNIVELVKNQGITPENISEMKAKLGWAMDESEWKDIETYLKQEYGKEEATAITSDDKGGEVGRIEETEGAGGEIKTLQAEEEVEPEKEKESTEKAEPPQEPPTVKKTEPKEPSGKKKKAALNRILESNAVKGDKKLQEAIEAKGLEYDVFTHEEARKIAQGIIEVEGIDRALEIARDRNSDISGNIRTFIYGKVLDQLTENQNEFKKQGLLEDSQEAADEWASIAEELDEYLRDAGRAIASVGDYYKSNAIGIQMRETNRLKRDAKKELEKDSKIEKVKEVEKEFNKIEEEIQRRVSEEIEKAGVKLFGKEKIDKINSALDKLKIKGMAFEATLGIPVAVWNGSIEAIKKAVKLGASIANAVNAGLEYIKENHKEKFDEKKYSENLSATLREIGIAEKPGKRVSKKRSKDDEADVKKKKLAVLNKIFPKKRIESGKKRREVHERIISAFDAGLFEGGINKEGRPFEELFYEKFGIVNPNKPEIQENLKKFSEKIHKAPEGSLLQKELYSDMLTYLENEKRQSLIDTGMSLWYANILSSYETHLRNSQFNIGTSLVSEPLLLAEKRILKGDVSGALKIFSNLFRDMGDAAAQAKAVWRGGVSKYEKPQAKSVLDKFQFGKGLLGSLLSPAKYPGRALRASDVFFTSMLANAKQYEVLKRTVEKTNPELSKAQQEVLVNEYLGNTTERIAAAEEQAKKDVEKVFEVDPLDPNNKAANEAYKLRIAEIIEQSRPKEIYEEGVDWARRSLLTNEPEGMWKGVAQSLRTLGEAVLPAKLVVPFVNVPVNLAARFIERGPIGYVNAIRGHRGRKQFRQELTQDQRAELFLKATNYTVAIIVLYQIMDALNDKEEDEKNPFVITGKQTGDYLDNKGITRGGGMEEYSIYMYGDKVMSYKYTPWAPLFAPLGYIRDHKKYGESKGLTSNMAYAAMNYIGFVNDQAAMKGLGNFLGMFDERSLKNITAEKLGERLTSTAQNFIVPMSGLVKATNTDIRAILGETDKVSTTWWDPILKDVPFVEEMMEKRTDHLGRDVKEVFDMPLLLEMFTIKETNDKYYKLFNEKGYFPNFYTNKTIFINNEEKEMSKEELYKLNKYRGDYAVEMLNSQDILPNDEEGGRTTLEYLKTLDKEDFKKEMSKIFEMGTERAKIKLFGAEWTNKKYDLMKESEANKYEDFKNKLKEE